jgi:hypothetical protein
LLGVSTDEVNDGFGILSNAFGLDWLNRAAEDVPMGRALPFRRHPIGDLLSTAGNIQLAELLELARYLRVLALIPGADTLIPALKASYYQTLFQAAFAAMSLAAGGDIERLEPASKSGRFADVDLIVDGESVRAECFRPTVRVPDDNERFFVAQQALEAVQDLPVIVSVAIAMKVRITPSVRREVVRVVKKLADDVSHRSASATDFPANLAEGEVAVVSVARAHAVPSGTPPVFVAAPGFPHSGETPSTFIRATQGYVKDLQGIAGSVSQGEGRSHIALWLLEDQNKSSSIDQSLEEPLVRLGKRLEKKVVQARQVGSGFRIIAVDTWITSQLHRADPVLLERLRGKIIESHDRVGALLLFKRLPARDNNGHYYAYLPLLPKARPGLSALFLARVNELPNVQRVNTTVT